jgi:hypothetical protein
LDVHKNSIVVAVADGGLAGAVIDRKPDEVQRARAAEV